MPTTKTDAPSPALIAPRWHTALLVAFFLILALAGAAFQRTARPAPASDHEPGVVPLYLSIAAGQWGLLYYLWKGGLRRRGVSLRELMGGRWRKWSDVALDLALAAGLWATWKGMAGALDRLLGPGQAASIQTFLPRSAVEIGAWCLVSTTAGICEEIIFRGYLLRQCAALTRSRWAGVLLQAALFGVSHGYQGAAACFKIAVYGVLFGCFALWRRSLRPGMIAHAGTDLLAGIFGI